MRCYEYFVLQILSNRYRKEIFCQPSLSLIRNMYSAENTSPERQDWLPLAHQSDTVDMQKKSVRMKRDWLGKLDTWRTAHRPLIQLLVPLYRRRSKGYL